jgi:hypothetical protein
MNKKETYQEELQARLDHWKVEIDQLGAKADEAHAEARLRFREDIEKLRAHQEKAEAKMKELRHAQGEAWQDLKSGIEAAWEELGNTVHKARKRFS